MPEHEIKPKHYVELALLRGVAGFVRILPYRCALCVGCMLAGLMHFVVRFRTIESRRRIREVFGDKLSEREIRRTAWRAWRNICFNVVELARMPRLNRAWIDRHIDNGNLHGVSQDLAKKHGGCIIATCHMGNWDLAGVTIHIMETPVFFIARRQKNPLTDEYLNRMRGATGVETILNDSSVLKNVIRKLKHGSILAILPDVRAKSEALDIHFLGGQANIGGGMALFARQTNVPILPVVLKRKGWSRHVWDVKPPIYPDLEQEKKDDWKRMTQEVMNHFDQAVHENPDQYFWFNKRWVLDPLGS